MNLLTGKIILTIAILLSSPSVCLVCLECTITQIWVFICFQIVYIFSHISQASLPLPVHFCHYFLHFSVSSAIFVIAVLLCSLQTVSDVSYATLQDFDHDQSGDHSCLGSMSIQKFFSCFLYLGESCCPSPVLLHFTPLERDLRTSSTSSWTENTIAA